MTKLGKNATRILAHMTSRYGRYGATVASGRGPEGGRIVGEGRRDYDACNELVRKGYAVLVDRRHFTISRHGYGVSCNEISIKLPEVP
jgi:hypothetical protein